MVSRKAAEPVTVIRPSLAKGAYYHYVNHTKRERFSIASVGGGLKFSSIGHSLSARAFSLILLGDNEDRSSDSPRIIGRWSGDSVSVEQDDSNPVWPDIERYLDIGADVLVMLIVVDGFSKIAEVARKDDLLFMQLAYLCYSGQAAGLRLSLEDYFVNASKRYKTLTEGMTYFQPLDLVLSAV